MSGIQSSDVSALGSTDMAHRFIIAPLTGRVAPSHLSSHPPFVDITRDDRAMSQNNWIRAMSRTVRWILKSHLVRVELMTSTIGA